MEIDKFIYNSLIFLLETDSDAQSKGEEDIYH